MSGCWERVAVVDGDAVPVRQKTALPDVIGPLERGVPADQLVRSLGLDAVDLVAVVAHDAIGYVEGPIDGPPLVQGSPRRPGLEAALSEEGIPALFPAASRPARLALAAGLLQIHDFWDASHHAAQLADDLGEKAVSAFWHGIGHRREPDAGNASYWFRRVGRHPSFDPLAATARSMAERSEEDARIIERLIPRGTWDPFAFIGMCGSTDPDDSRLALILQRVEMRLLLDASIP